MQTAHGERWPVNSWGLAVVTVSFLIENILLGEKLTKLSGNCVLRNSSCLGSNRTAQASATAMWWHSVPGGGIHSEVVSYTPSPKLTTKVTPCLEQTSRKICHWPSTILGTVCSIIVSNRWQLFNVSLVKSFKNLFLAVLGLCCCRQAFSSCSKRGLLSSCSAQVAHCSGFSYNSAFLAPAV